MSEWAYEQIQDHIKTAKKFTHGYIVLDLDNQEYIIAVLEACSKRYSKDSPVEEHRKKAEWYKNAAIQARRRKEQYVIKLAGEAKDREKNQSISNIFMILGLLIIVAFVIFFFSL